MAGVLYKVMQCMYVTCGVTTQFLWILMECLSISVCLHCLNYCMLRYRLCCPLCVRGCVNTACEKGRTFSNLLIMYVLLTSCHVLFSLDSFPPSVVLSCLGTDFSLSVGVLNNM